ncbi:phytanoyl-CoA dioxygenase family protein [Desertimonas flava]|uniref:phytanoyl-CoA dioxygenase family protein n=1 Tax=Desertimonas flava TaxID=2064846 RepID=UPI000E343AFD|nr:phytanoyl-CoA dioxygenase family protein [Desertimonas flava]
MTSPADAFVAAFRDDGFVVIPELADAATVDELRGAYDDVLADGRHHGDRLLGGLTRQVMLPHLAHETFASNAALQRTRPIAAALLGGDVEFYFDMLIDKPAGHPHTTPWHQDMSYSAEPFAPVGTPLTMRNVQFWLALDDVDANGGGMQFIAGRHRGPMLAHHVAAGDPTDNGRLLAIVDPDESLDLSAAVTPALRPGDATAHAYGTPHFTGPNRSGHQRRAYIFNFRLSGGDS